MPTVLSRTVRTPSWRRRKGGTLASAPFDEDRDENRDWDPAPSAPSLARGGSRRRGATTTTTTMTGSGGSVAPSVGADTVNTDVALRTPAAAADVPCGPVDVPAYMVAAASDLVDSSFGVLAAAAGESGAAAAAAAQLRALATGGVGGGGGAGAADGGSTARGVRLDAADNDAEEAGGGNRGDREAAIAGEAVACGGVSFAAAFSAPEDDDEDDATARQLMRRRQEEEQQQRGGTDIPRRQRGQRRRQHEHEQQQQLEAAEPLPSPQVLAGQVRRQRQRQQGHDRPVHHHPWRGGDDAMREQRDYHQQEQQHPPPPPHYGRARDELERAKLSAYSIDQHLRRPHHPPALSDKPLFCDDSTAATPSVAPSSASAPIDNHNSSGVFRAAPSRRRSGRRSPRATVPSSAASNASSDVWGHVDSFSTDDDDNGVLSDNNLDNELGRFRDGDGGIHHRPGDRGEEGKENFPRNPNDVAPSSVVGGGTYAAAAAGVAACASPSSSAAMMGMRQAAQRVVAQHEYLSGANNAHHPVVAAAMPGMVDSSFSTCENSTSSPSRSQLSHQYTHPPPPDTEMVMEDEAEDILRLSRLDPHEFDGGSELYQYDERYDDGLCGDEEAFFSSEDERDHHGDGGSPVRGGRGSRGDEAGGSVLTGASGQTGLSRGSRGGSVDTARVASACGGHVCSMGAAGRMAGFGASGGGRRSGGDTSSARSNASSSAGGSVISGGGLLPSLASLLLADDDGLADEVLAMTLTAGDERGSQVVDVGRVSSSRRERQRVRLPAPPPPPRRAIDSAADVDTPTLTPDRSRSSGGGIRFREAHGEGVAGENGATPPRHDDSGGISNSVADDVKNIVSPVGDRGGGSGSAASTGVRFAYPPVTSVRNRPRTSSDDVDDLFFTEEEMDRIRSDRRSRRGAGEGDIECVVEGTVLPSERQRQQLLVEEEEEQQRRMEERVRPPRHPGAAMTPPRLLKKMRRKKEVKNRGATPPSSPNSRSSSSSGTSASTGSGSGIGAAQSSASSSAGDESSSSRRTPKGSVTSHEHMDIREDDTLRLAERWKQIGTERDSRSGGNKSRSQSGAVPAERRRRRRKNKASPVSVIMEHSPRDGPGAVAYHSGDDDSGLSGRFLAEI